MSYIMVAVESDGPIPGDYTMVCFGVVGAIGYPVKRNAKLINKILRRAKIVEHNVLLHDRSANFGRAGGNLTYTKMNILK